MQARDPASWAITPAEKAKYDDLFKSMGGDSQGFITGPQFSVMSQLALGDAGQIFKLADIDKDLKLNKREFAIAMFLTERKKERHQISNVLPPSLIDSATALFPLQNSNSASPFNSSYNQNTASGLYPIYSVPSYNPNVPSTNSSYNPNMPATNPSYNPNVSSTNSSYNPNAPSTNPSYNPNIPSYNPSAVNSAPPLNRTYSQPLSFPNADVSRVISDKDAMITNLQTQLAQANDARLHAEDARKHTENLLIQANVRIAQLQTNAIAHAPASSTQAHAPPAYAPHANAPPANAPPAYAPQSPTSSAETLDALQVAVNASASAQDINNLCVRLKAILVSAKQRRVELEQIAQQRKIDELESSLTCPICMDQKKNVSCVPCGHALCRACADAMVARNNRKCPICREPVQQTNAIFL